MAVVGTWNLENLYRPGGQYGPRDQAAYRAKLAALAATIAREDLDVVAVQEVGDPGALDDLAGLLPGSPPGSGWATTLSEYPDARGIRVGFLSRLPMGVVDDVVAFPDGLAPVQATDAGGDGTGHGTDDGPDGYRGGTTGRMGRGALAVRIAFTSEDRTAGGAAGDRALVLVTCHLKSKLLSYPGGRFAPRDEDERARAGAYALYRRAAEAVTVRAVATRLLDGQGGERRVVVLGDVNDGVDAATTQLLHGPPGSQLGTAGADRPDEGDGMRLWNLAARIPEAQRYSRVYRGRGELIDHVLVSRALLDATADVRAVVDRGLPSVGDDPGERRDAGDSDHAPVVVRVEP